MDPARFAEQITSTERRFAERALERTATEARIQESGPFAADTPERVAHRNQTIQQRQGNRNTLIDHPDWAARIAFAGGFG